MKDCEVFSQSDVSGNSKKTTVKLFNFIKRQPKTDFSPEQTIRRSVEYMPDFYKTQRQFVNCVEFLENREWELALDSLIELADETGHYFSEQFWLGLADAADKMDLTEKVNYCINDKENISIQIWSNDIGDEVCSNNNFKWEFYNQNK